MRANLTFLQDMQDAYAERAKLAICICDLEGDILTGISWGNRETEKLYGRYVTKENLQTFLKPLQSIDQTTLMDTAFGNKLIVSPIKVKGKATHFVISGFIVDEQTKESADNYLEENGLPSIKNGEFDVLPLSEILRKVNYIRTMTEVMVSYVSLHNENNNSKSFSAFLANKLDSIKDGTSTIDSILECKDYFDDVDFLALALKSKESVYKVESSIGEYSIPLGGYEFSNGEGLLGYSIATKRPQFFKNIENDARVLAFRKINMKVISLFCYPLVKDNIVIGLLFAGSSKREMDETSVYDNLCLCASLMNNHINMLEMQNKISNQLTEISTLSEIISVLSTVKDLKRVFDVVVDLCLSLTQGAFVSIVYRNNLENDHVEIVSRGLSNEEITKYCYGAADRVFSEEFQRPLMNKTSWGVDVMEFPLVFDKDIYGILSVSFISTIHIENYTQIITSLSKAGAIAVRQLSTPEKVEIENTLYDNGMKRLSRGDALNELNLTVREIEVLKEVVKGFSNKEIAEVLHISDHTVKNHMTHILAKLAVSDRSQAIAKVYQMGYFSPN